MDFRPFLGHFLHKSYFLYLDTVEIVFIRLESTFIFVLGINDVTRIIIHTFFDIRNHKNGYFPNPIFTFSNSIQKYPKNGLKSVIFQIFQKSRIRMILIFCIPENVTGSERNRNLRYLTSIWGQF